MERRHLHAARSLQTHMVEDYPAAFKHGYGHAIAANAQVAGCQRKHEQALVVGSGTSVGSRIGSAVELYRYAAPVDSGFHQRTAGIDACEVYREACLVCSLYTLQRKQYVHLMGAQSGSSRRAAPPVVGSGQYVRKIF